MKENSRMTTKMDMEHYFSQMAMFLLGGLGMMLPMGQGSILINRGGL